MEKQEKVVLTLDSYEHGIMILSLIHIAWASSGVASPGAKL